MVTAWWRGARLVRFRRQRNLSQAALARAVGVDVMTVSRWERNVRRPSTRTLLRLAKALRVPVTDLLP